ncbi:sensor domain-containing protein [Massilia horti]|uniref:sensor domain-containing protein n=1 Tax=Massilia horti TaxID=2562153 RepID=UPI001431B2E2|nr:EAL domain-containing protein [Massilia horti]
MLARTSVAPGVAILGTDENIRFANAAFVSLIGHPVDEVVGKPLSAFYDMHRAEFACLAGVREAIAAGKEFCGTLHAEQFVAELCLVPVRDEAGAPRQFVVVMRDITGADRAEVELKETSRRFHDLFEHLPAGVVVHGPDTKILAANHVAAQWLGTNVEQMIGRGADDPAWRFIRKDNSPMQVAEQPVCRTIASKRNLSNLVIGVEHGEPQGKLWALCNTYHVCENGQLSEVVVCFTDCTELKRTEESLQKSEERLRLILQGSNDASWDWNLTTGELYYAPRWWQMVGRAENELPADEWLWLRLTHPEDQSRVLETFERALVGEKSAYEFELRLQHKDGHYVPVLLRGHIQRDAHGKAVRVSGTNTDLTERKAAESRIHQLAYFDYLTGLPNRRFLMEELHKLLSRSTRNGQIGALLFIDLDNFKLLNDTMGHDVGDLLLRQAAHRLRHTVREGDYVARLGGDEFVIVLDELGTDMKTAAAEADLVGHKVLAVCAEDYALPGRAYRSTATIGITLFDGHSEGVEALLKQADVAMYQAKAAGRNTLRFFDPIMQATIDQRYELEHDLREGLLRHEFRLFCQPQFDAAGRLVGGEVLLRWQHPQRGLVAPAEFVATAEATGLMVPVGRWVLGESCRRLAAWADDPVLGTIPLSVNVSAQQVRTPRFAADTLAVIADTGADPSRLSLELTESLLAENIEDVIEKMNRLKQAGIHFSIDDFGTGYSSLSYLKRFPLETLKIDQSFVHDILRDPNAAAIVEVIITLARKLGLQVVAEGVEQEAQRELLRQGGCDRFQGYLLGMPVSIDEFARRYGAAH